MSVSLRPADTTPAAYVPPRVAIHPPTRPWFDYPRPGSGRATLRIVLNTRTGSLYAQPSPHGNNDHGPYYDPQLDLWQRAWGYERTPRLIAWYASNWSWTKTSADTATQLARIAPTAQHLLDHLAPVPGTAGEWDWTPAATAAEDRITAGVRSTERADDEFWMAPLPDRGHYGVVSVAELLDTRPDVADATWLTMSDAELDAVAADLCGTPDRPSGRHIPSDVQDSIRDRYHPRRSEWPGYLPIFLVGGRIGLRAWRAAALEAHTGLPTKQAGEHLTTLTTPAVDRLTAVTTDAELEQLAAEVNAEIGHRDRVALVGTLDYLRRLRAEMRARVRSELSALGVRYARAAAELQQISAARTGLLHQVVAFREHPEWTDADEPNYAELGRLAHMTRQSARETIREALRVGPDGETIREALTSYVRLAGPQGVTLVEARRYLRNQLGELMPLDAVAAILRDLRVAGEIETFEHRSETYYRGADEQKETPA